MTQDDAERDETLAARASKGARPIFQQLIRRHKEATFRFVRRYVGNSDDAYDVLQEAFLAAWLALPRYDAARPFLPWFRIIVLNKCRDFSRRQKIRRLVRLAYAGEAERQQHLLTAPQLPEAENREQERLRQLDSAIAALPAFYKEPLLLTAVSGLSHEQAADLLRTTPKAVEMRLRRARKKLGDGISEAKREG